MKLAHLLLGVLLVRPRLIEMRELIRELEPAGRVTRR